MVNEFLTHDDLEHIKTHKYATAGYSWLDTKMNPFWIKSAEFLPYWLSPNMVTIIGLIVLSLGVVLILPFDSTMSVPLPPFLYILFAIFVFIGQTLDAIDGKHARNTGRSSPLGQLMDHGCDAFSNSFVVIMIGQAHLLGSSLYAVGVQILVQLSFYIITWEEHHTGVLLTHIDHMGVTEFQFIGMGVIMLPVFLGNEFSHFRPIKSGPLSFTIAELLFFFNALFSIKIVIQRTSILIKTKEDFLKKFFPLYSLIILVAAELLSTQLLSYQTHTIYILILNAILFGYMTSKLIVCNMAKKQIESFSWDNLLYLVLIIASILSKCLYVEIICLSICAVIVTARYAYYMLSLTFQLLRFLNIKF